MKKEQTKKQKKSNLTVGILVALALFMLIKGIILQPQITDNKDKIAELNSLIDYEQERADEVDELKENVDSDEYIEKVAREKLGMIRKDEIVFVDISGKE